MGQTRLQVTHRVSGGCKGATLHRPLATGTALDTVKLFGSSKKLEDVTRVSVCMYLSEQGTPVGCYIYTAESCKAALQGVVA